MTGLASTPSERPCGVNGVVGLVDLEADDLTAVEVEDHREKEPPSFHMARQEGHIPAPDFARIGGNRGGGLAGCPCARSTRWIVDPLAR